MRPQVTVADLERGIRVFAENEPRDAMYRISRHLVELHWGSPAHTEITVFGWAQVNQAQPKPVDGGLRELGFVTLSAPPPGRSVDSPRETDLAHS